MRTHLLFVALGSLALFGGGSCGSVSAPNHTPDAASPDSGKVQAVTVWEATVPWARAAAPGRRQCDAGGVGGGTGAGGTVGAGGWTEAPEPAAAGPADRPAGQMGALAPPDTHIVLAGGLETVGPVGTAGSVQVTRASFAVLKTRVCNSTVCVSGRLRHEE